MLLQFSCSNFRSIKDNITFSMRSFGDNSKNKRVVHFNNLDFERISVIYGANGSGKSNFVEAVNFACSMIINSMAFQPGQYININTHKLLGNSVPSVFTFHFEIDDARYVYSFSVLNGLIDDEFLYFFPKNRQVKIFSRKGMTISAGSKYKNSFDLSLNALQDNRLFLSCAANFSRVDEIKKTFIFFSNKMVVYKVSIDEPRNNNWYEYSVKIMQSNPELKKKFLMILKLLDTGIKDVKAEIKNISADEVKEFIPESFKKVLPEIMNNGITTFNSAIVYKDFETDLITEESTGIQKLFQMICPMLDILENGKILICDEIETGLHEAVVQKIIELFYELSSEKKAQLIFTTHNTSLLNNSIFRRCQIWFTQLTNERATDLYSLLEIRNVRKDENLARGYINGKYGAIPVLNSGFNEIINS